ncbi:MAG: hypothetical protein OXG06_03560 [Gammaproteobacteria bacterium]|nr:hypothetical protein [Gammaproteobacteria bacterium]
MIKLQPPNPGNALKYCLNQGIEKKIRVVVSRQQVQNRKRRINDGSIVHFTDSLPVVE